MVGWVGVLVVPAAGGGLMAAGEIREAPDGLERWIERERREEVSFGVRYTSVYTSTVAFRTNTAAPWALPSGIGSVAHFDSERWEEFPLVFRGFASDDGELVSRALLREVLGELMPRFDVPLEFGAELAQRLGGRV